MTPAELERTLRALLGRGLGDAELREQLEKLAIEEISFSGFTWLYGPMLYRRNRVLFRPFILSHFSDYMILPKWRTKSVPWKDEKARILEAWLKEVDANDDADLFRRLYNWRLGGSSGRRKSDDRQIVAELQSRFRAATTPAQRQNLLRKFDLWFELDEENACTLYERDARSAGPFILRRLPSTWSGAEKRKLWTRLLKLAASQQDEDFRWRLYRRQAPLTDWSAEVLVLCDTIKEPAELCRELERRHPDGPRLNLAEGFLHLIQRRGRDVFPYVIRHLRQVWAGVFGRGSYGKLADHARQQGWWDLWSVLIRTCSGSKEFNAEVTHLLEDRLSPEKEIVQRLLALAGASREWNWPGIGLATVHQLEEPVALELYKRFPNLVRGPYKPHIQANQWGQRYPQFLRRLIELGDEEMIDHLASRLVTRCGSWGNSTKLLEDADLLAGYYESLKKDEAAFSRRAASVLNRVPAYSIGPYNVLIRENRLARLLFERSARAYLADPHSLADLVEASEIHVMALAYRALGMDDDRARAQAANHLPLLLGTLLRPMQRHTRILAFGALANAADTSETARAILDRARDAFLFPDKRYPKEQLLGLVARLINRWPELRSPREQPLIYRSSAV